MPERNPSFLQLIRRDRRGRLKIYLGYAAGVGKTHQMLQEAHRLRQEGVDLVLGLVETHARLETAALAEGLETVPVKRTEYHGISVEEMDLDAILARKPHVVLVDDLAHANAPGSRNPKRYQDAEDILAAGINVIATLNVQHLESLYDTVERMMGVKVRERVPDSVLAEADQIVNVDISAEDLLKRLRAGKVFPLDKVDAALVNFFQFHHLEELRELTLREAASQIDFRRRETENQGNKGGTDQVMACLDARGPENAALLRYASRLAGRLNRNWYAVYVQPLEGRGSSLDGSGQKLLSETLLLANQLGATVFTLKGDDVADTLARFAAEYRVGHIILGKPHPRPWWKMFSRKKDVVGPLMEKSDGFTLILIDTRPGIDVSSPVEDVADSVPVPAAKAGERLKLCDFLGEGQIVVWEEAVSKEQAMRDLVRTLLASHPSLDEGFLLRKLKERENQGSTFLNEGVALPHSRMENLERPLVALGLSHGGILDAGTENPIEVVYLLFSPKDENRSHLQLLAVGARLMLNRTLRTRLRKANRRHSAYRCLLEFENPE